MNEEAKVESFCNSVFSLQFARRRGAAEKSFEVFRFDTTRLYYKLKPAMGDEQGHLEKYRLIFEVQVKSAFEHAWSTATHDLTFKSNQIDWRRQRLAAQIKAIVEQMDIEIVGFEAMTAFIPQNPDRRLESKRRIGEIFTGLFDQKRVPSEAMPQDLSRFVDNFVEMVRVGGGSWRRSVAVAERIAEIIKAIPIDQFPRSLSLFQVCFAEATLHSLISDPDQDYTPAITSEMETLYPHVRRFARRFMLT